MFFDDGVDLIRKTTVAVNAKAGQLWRSDDGLGYYVVGIRNRLYLVHRVLWCMRTGAWPLGVIDHLNRNTKDNSVANLRDTTQAENVWNGRVRLDNTTGIKGVNRYRGKFRVNMEIHGKVYSKNGFNCIQEALAYRLELVRIHRGDAAARREAALYE